MAFLFVGNKQIIIFATKFNVIKDMLNQSKLIFLTIE